MILLNSIFPYTLTIQGGEGGQSHKMEYFLHPQTQNHEIYENQKIFMISKRIFLQVFFQKKKENRKLRYSTDRMGKSRKILSLTESCQNLCAKSELGKFQEIIWNFMKNLKIRFFPFLIVHFHTVFENISDKFRFFRQLWKNQENLKFSKRNSELKKTQKINI